MILNYLVLEFLKISIQFSKLHLTKGSETRSGTAPSTQCFNT